MTDQAGERHLRGLAIVDAHCHVWDRRHLERAWPDAPTQLARSFSVDDLERSCGGTPVTSAVLIEAGTTSEETAFLEASAAAPIVAAFVAYADPLTGEVGPGLDRLMRHPKFRGVRLRFEGRPAEALDDPRVLGAAREIAARGLALDLLVTTEHLAAVVRLANAVPDLRAIVDHLAKPDMRDGSDDDAWRRLVTSIGTDTALLFKASLSPRAADIAWMAAHPLERWSAGRTRPYLEHLLETVGPRRLAWGSDWPVGVFGDGHASALAAISAGLGPLDEIVADQLFRSTAASFYRIV